LVIMHFAIVRLLAESVPLLAVTTAQNAQRRPPKSLRSLAGAALDVVGAGGLGFCATGGA